MALRSHTTQRSSCVNPLSDPTREQNKLTDTQNQARRSDAGNNKAFTLCKAPTPTLVSPPAKDLFTKFMKVFVETKLAQALASHKSAY